MRPLRPWVWVAALIVLAALTAAFADQWAPAVSDWLLKTRDALRGDRP